MPAAISNPAPGPALPVADPHRAELEQQLHQAIRRAEQQYRRVLEAPALRPAANPPHLGVKVDIRV
jgi:hypothetical protein